MNYHTIPSYEELFHADTFNNNLPIHVDLAAFALSFLGYLYTEHETMNTTLLEESLGIRGIDLTRAREYLKDKTAITQLGILNAWKFSFENLKKEQEVGATLNDTLNLLYRIIIREQESSIDQIGDISVQNALMTGGILDYLDNQTSELIRTFYMFIENRDRFSGNIKYKGYAEIFDKFHDKYGITIEDYLKGLYVIVFCKCHHNFENLIQTKDIRNHSFIIDPRQIESLKTRTYVTRVLETLCFDYTTAKEWAVESRSNTFDFNLFMGKPLYKMSEYNYLPVCRKFMQDQLFNSLIYKIRELYDEKDKSFFNLLGFLFEDYVTYIFNKVLEKNKTKYEIINEFEYRVGKKRKKSPDLIISFENDVYVIECKAARILNSIYKISNGIKIQESIDKVIKKPISQAITRMNEIVELGINVELNDNKNYYFISVTISNFPDHFSDFEALKVQMMNSKFNIAGCFNLSIEEYEMLCNALIQNEKTLGYFLNDFKYNNPEHYSFKNFIKKYVEDSSQIFKEIEERVDNFLDSIDL